MNTYLILIRGINVGGKNKIPMAELKKALVKQGFSAVMTYIASGNVILKSDHTAQEVKARVEKMLPEVFRLDVELIKVLVLTGGQLRAVINNRPHGFGDQPDKFHSDAIFLIDIGADAAMSVFDPREGVDNVWAGKGVIYSQRLSELRVKSRLSKIVGTPAYKSMTIRNWNTTTKLMELMDAAEKDAES